MAKILRLRRGTAAQHAAFTGLEGEITVDTTNDTLRVHDNVTVGGHILASRAYVDDVVTDLEAGNINLGNIDITGNVISTIGTNEDLIIEPNGSGNVVIASANLHLEEALSGIRLGPNDEGRLRLQTANGQAYLQLSSTAGYNHDLVLSSGTSGIRIKHTTGRVGINTDNPTTSLDVVGGINTNRYTASNGLVTAGYTFPYGEGYTGIYHIAGNASSTLRIIHDNVESMTISHTGDVTIAGNLDVGNVISTSTTNQDLNLVPNGSGDVIIHSNLLPGANLNYTLGDIGAEWHSLYVGSNTIYIGGTALSIDNTGNLTVGGNAISVNTDSISNGNSNVTVSTANGNVDIAANTYSWNFSSVDGTTTIPNNIYVDGQTLGLGSVTNGVNIYANLSGALKTWSFEDNGNLEFPTNGGIVFDGGGILQSPDEDFTTRVQDADDDGFSIYQEVDDGNDTVLGRTRLQRDQFMIEFPASTQYRFNDSGQMEIPGNIRCTEYVDTSIYAVSNNDGAGSAELKVISYSNDTLGSNVRVTQSNATISTNNAQWTWEFDNGGDLTVPKYIKFAGNTFIGDEPGAGTPYFRIDTPLGYPVTITTDSDISGNNWAWTFGANGVLTLPGAGTIRAQLGSDSPSPGNVAGAGSSVYIYAGNAGSNGGNISDGAAGGDIIIQAGDGSSGYGASTFLRAGEGPSGNGDVVIDTRSDLWTFRNANIIFPDSSVQTTAYPGSANITSLGILTSLTVDNVSINNSTISTVNTNQDLTLDPNGSGNVVITGNLLFSDSTVQTTAWTGNFGYLTAEKDTVKGTAGYQYTFATDGYFTNSTSSESTNYFFVAYNATNANIAAGWTVVGGTANTTVSSVTYPVAGYPGVIRVNLTAAASSTSGFYPVTVSSPDRLSVEIQPNPGTSDKFTFTTSGLTFPDATSQTTAFTGNAATVDITNTNGIDTNYSITFVENRSATQELRADVDLTFNSATNLLTVGNVTTGILKIEDGVHEKFQAKQDATGTVTHDCSSGHIFYHTSPDANWTANFTNLGLESGYATAVTLVIVQGGTGYYPNAVEIGGAAQTINWQGNTTPTPSTNRTDIVTFSIINNSSTYTVLGQLTGF